MSELKIRGSVIYGPGVWGLSVPVAGARVVLRQNSIGVSEPRPIWEGVTDAKGEFSGTTGEWRRLVQVKVGPVEKEIPDPADALALTIRVELGGQSSVRPFPYIADFVPVPPVIVGWTPPNAVIARIDGRDCYTLGEVARQCLELMRSPRAVEIEVAVESLLADGRNQEQKLDRLIGWWLSDLARRLKPPPGQSSTPLASTLFTTLRDRQREAAQDRQTATRMAVAEVRARWNNEQDRSQTSLETSVLMGTLTVIFIVLSIVATTFTYGAAVPLITLALIALVQAVATTGSVSVPAVVRAVLGVFIGCGGSNLDVAVDAVVAVVSIVLLVALVFMLAGGQAFGWVKTTVLNGRRGWRFHFH